MGGATTRFPQIEITWPELPWPLTGGCEERGWHGRVAGAILIVCPDAEHVILGRLVVQHRPLNLVDVHPNLDPVLIGWATTLDNVGDGCLDGVGGHLGGHPRQLQGLMGHVKYERLVSNRARGQLLFHRFTLQQWRINCVCGKSNDKHSESEMVRVWMAVIQCWSLTATVNNRYVKLIEVNSMSIAYISCVHVSGNLMSIIGQFNINFKGQLCSMLWGHP